MCNVKYFYAHIGCLDHGLSPSYLDAHIKQEQITQWKEESEGNADQLILNSLPKTQKLSTSCRESVLTLKNIYSGNMTQLSKL